MNKEHKDNLNKVADYLDKGPEGLFDMKSISHCVIGHIGRALGVRTHAVYQEGEKTFGVFGPDLTFCCGAQWSNCPKAAAVRLRYVAQHDAAPSADQWARFNYVPAVEELAEIVKELAEIEPEVIGNFDPELIGT